MTTQSAPAVILPPAEFALLFDKIIGNVEKVIRGKREAVERSVLCLLAEGHLLVEDLPGLGKTRLARGIAASLGLSFSRVQFTPDLLPADITGSEIYNQKTADFEFRRGPLFANLVLADEINRASPKTQSALLEAMEERQVTAGGRTWLLPHPFLVIATQNPVDMGGTYPLPEAQLDRFLLRVKLGYPSSDAEVGVLRDHHAGVEVSGLDAVVTATQVGELSIAASRIQIADRLYRYIVEIVSATRRSPSVELGASPRASVALMRACRVRALARGRDRTEPDDVQALAVPVLAHRLILTPETQNDPTAAESVVKKIIDTTSVPHH